MLYSACYRAHVCKQYQCHAVQCNIQLGQSELAEGKPPCMYWRSVPISNNAVMRLQPALPPLGAGSGPQFPTWTSEHAAAAVWAMEGYFMVCVLTVLPAPLQSCVHLCSLAYNFAVLLAPSLHALPTYTQDVGMLCSCALPCTWLSCTSLANISFCFCVNIS